MNEILVVRIFSFSFHVSGIPEDTSGNNGGFVFDCRFLPNPGREIRYTLLTGKDEEVIEYFSKYSIVSKFLNNVFQIADFAVDNYQSRGFTDLMISFGCTGGQHRSVFCAERLKEFLEEKDIKVKLHHIELEKMKIL